MTPLRPGDDDFLVTKTRALRGSVFVSKSGSVPVSAEGHERDFDRNDDFLALGVPSGTVADEHGVSAGCDLCADYLEMFIHSFGVGRPHDDSRADAAAWANGTVDVCVRPTVIAHHGGTRANGSPHA